MVKKRFSMIIGLLILSASVIACGDDDDNGGDGSAGSDQKDGQGLAGAAGSADTAGTGGAGGSEPSDDGTGPAPDGGSAEPTPDGGTIEPGPDGGTVDPTPDSGTTDTPAITCTGDQVPVNGECVDRKLPDNLEPGWNQIDPGPPTTCIYGAPYSFYVREGTVNRLLLFLQGGGACWDALTCAMPIYSQTVSGPGSSGIMDPDNDANPFKDWYVVFAPYCSGDVFFGDATQNFGVNPAQFKGFVNMTAIREWITENITAPEFIFVSGCSAGAVGVTLHGAYLTKSYIDNPEIDGAMVTDSFQGIITDGFVGMDTWNVSANFPDWLPELKSMQSPFPGDTMARGMKEALSLPEFSDFVAANFNFANDSTQGTYYGFMGGTGDIGTLISEAVHDISAAVPDNYSYYIAPGTQHCVFESDGVYDIEVGGVRLIDWLGIGHENPHPGATR
jgi:hypothetical protein